MLPDFHIHTAFSGDSDTPAKKQIEQCISLGMRELCITDHHDYDSGMEEEIFILDFDTYLPALCRLHQEYQSRIQVNIGVELGLQLHLKDYLESLVSSLDVDFIIGSCHFIDQKDPYDPTFFQGISEQEAYRHYFEVTLKRVQSLDCYDSLGHLDYMIRYGPTKNKNYSYHAYQEYIDPILKTLIQKGKALECNTAGFRYHLGQPNPSQDILKRYQELGGELITLGSDAHTPTHIGHSFPQVKALLEACGFHYLTTYHHRRPTPIPLT